MPGDPQPGEVYRQEYYPPGQALDEARVLSRDSTQTEQKYYASGIGEIAERVVKGHHEQFKLVSVTL